MDPVIGHGHMVMVLMKREPTEIYCAKKKTFIKGHRKSISGVISIKHSRDITNKIHPLQVE